MSKSIDTIIFDLGGVLVDWNPRYVFNATYFDTKEQLEQFFSEICSLDWNEEQDAGRSIVEATQERVKQFPEWESAIRDYYGRWTEMLKGPIHETVELFKQIKESGKYKTYALTNWQTGLFDIALVRYSFLHWFDGRVVSGEEKVRKPFPEFYERLLSRYNVDRSKALFIDDNIRNIKAAEALGIQSHHFTTPEELQKELIALQII